MIGAVEQADNPTVADEPETYCHATLVRLAEDDPVNGHDAGMEWFVEGDHSDGYVRKVMTCEECLDLDCEVVEVFEAPCPMTCEEVLSYAVEKAKDRRADA